MYSTLELYIDGKFRGGRGGSEPMINPATAQPIAELPHACEQDLDEALAAAARAFPEWSATPANERAKILKRAAELVRERIDAIAETLTLEQGKPVAESKGEVLYAADVIEWYAEEAKRAYGRVIPSRFPGQKNIVQLEPVGVVAAFTPWNFPALTPARKIGGALAAGCTLILKAAEETPGTAVELIRAVHDAGAPAGVVNLVFGEPAKVSSHLIASPIVRKVSFTGSVPIGKQLVRMCADDMKRTTMELGGHAPVVVCADTDVESVAKMVAAGKYRNAGQVCIAPTRFYVEEGAYDAFVDAFSGVAKSQKLGAGLEDGVTMGPLANARRVDAMERFVDDAKKRGAEVPVGGKRWGNEGYFYEPTVVIEPSDDSLLMTEEPFGPVAPIVRFKSIEEVLERANSLPFGLAAYAFTGSNATASKLANGLKAGMVGMNSLAVSNPETPFGGVRDSGHGQEGGLEGLQAYFDMKMIAHV